MLIVLKIKGGALDPDLSKESDAYPLDENGVPTLRPSATWYMNQLDFPNAREIRTLDSKVTAEGDDLLISKRIEGHFFERFKLHDFPFDAQDLAITVSTNCATEGAVPVRFVVPDADDVAADELDRPQLGVDVVNFAHSDIWDLSPRIYTSVTTVGASSKRRFSAVHLRAHVKRRSNFVLMNVAVPVSIISFLSLMTFLVPPEEIADGLDLNFTILLTGVAFKYTTTLYLPQVSYTTLVDKYALLCTLVIVVSCLFRTVLGILDSWANVSDDTLELLNKVFLGILAALWCFVQVLFLFGYRSTQEPNKAAQRKDSRYLQREGSSKPPEQLDRYKRRQAALDSQPVNVSCRRTALQSEHSGMAINVAKIMATYKTEDLEE